MAQGGIRKRSGILMVQSEATYGVDPGAWSVASHGVVAYEVSFSPLDQLNMMERAPLAGANFIGRQTSISGIHSSRVTCKVPLVGSGNNTSVASLKPDWEPFALACNLVRDATNDVAGPPPTRAYKLGANGTSCAVKLLMGPASDLAANNWTEYLMLGCAGSAKIIGGTTGDAATFDFDLQGSFVQPLGEQADPGDPTLVEVCPPSFLNVGMSWTPNGLTAHVPRLKSFELDFGNTVAQRTDLNLPSGIAGFIVTDQNPKASLQVSNETPDAADTPNLWKDAINACTRYGVLEVGKVGAGSDGASFQITANKANVESVGMGDADGLDALDVTWALGQDLSALSTPALQILLD